MGNGEKETGKGNGNQAWGEIDEVYDLNFLFCFVVTAFSVAFLGGGGGETGEESCHYEYLPTFESPFLRAGIRNQQHSTSPV